MKQSSLRGFTLVELLISIVIIGILTWVIFSVYRKILDITLRVENEKIVANEMLFAHQTVQNLVDNYTVDYNTYRTLGNQIVWLQWVTTILYLTGRWGTTIYQWSYKIELVSGAILLTKNALAPIPITDNTKVIVTGLQFQLIPYNTTGAWGGSIPIGSLNFPTVSDIYHPGFWVRGTMELKRYKQNSYIYSVRQPIQSFFNIRSY